MQFWQFFSRRPALLVPHLDDHVLYAACRACGWRANISNGIVMRDGCPVCTVPMLTVLGGTIDDVARRLAHFPDTE